MSAIRDAVLREIDNLDEGALEAVLATIRGNGHPLGAGMSGEEFVRRFGGLIPADELGRMDAAIERDCETVEPDNGREATSLRSAA
jgi:hypothetical protein